jgi:1,4-dihydroxy-2-naphthoate polyprenyltransferase
MPQKPIGFLKMIRAPFLSSIISPMIIGTLLAWYINGQLEVWNFILVLIMGICLHIATNVYNDIYDTIQGTDKLNVNRNEFSGGSGVIIDNPNLLPVMYRIARIGLIGAMVATVLLFFRVHDDVRIYLIFLYLLSAFFSKFYTAAPIKLAYRGWGEISVWVAFGPMAILDAAVSQNVAFHPIIMAAMPITGISTLSVLLIGQMIDLDADKATGKWGIAARRGNKMTAYVYLAVQLLLCVNVVMLSVGNLKHGWLVLISLIPYAWLLPKITTIILRHYDDARLLKNAAKLNVLLHLLFSVLCIVGIFLVIIIY